MDQVDISFVFLNCRVDENRVGIAQIFLHLVEQAWNLADPRKDVAQPHVLWRVALRERKKNRVADQLDRNGWVMAIALNVVQLEQAETNLIVDEVPIGGVLGSKRRDRSLGAKALPPLGVESALLGKGCEAHVVQQSIELDGFAGFRVNVLVISGGGRVRGGHRQRILHELVAQLGELCRSGLRGHTFLRCRGVARCRCGYARGTVAPNRPGSSQKRDEDGRGEEAHERGSGCCDE